MKPAWWSRRVFIGGIIGTMASAYAVAIGRGALKPCGSDELDVPLAALQPFIRVGETYLRDLIVSAEATLNDELSLLQSMAAPRLDEAAQQRLAAVECTSEREFERGDTVTCDGWVLSRSEAR